MKPKYAPLFAPLVFPNGITARNRVALAPMTHYSSNEDGSSIPEEFPYIKRRSRDVGLVLTACYAVTHSGKAYVGEPYITDDKFIPDLMTLAKTIKSQGAIAVLQLHHGGGVCPPELVPGGDVVAPSAVSIPGRSLVTPRALSADEIDEVIIAFSEATRRAIAAGFDGVELHGAYGYLLQQFVSPYSNLRTDRWEQRFAFPLALIEVVRQTVQQHAKSAFLIGYRFTPEEALQPGLTMMDALDFTEVLAASGIDFIDVLLNDYRSTPRAGLADLSENRLTLIGRKIAGRCILLGGGSIYRADEGLEAHQTGVDMITLGREMIIDPEWLAKIARGDEEKIITCIREGSRIELEIPLPFWQEIWREPGWFPGTEQQ